MKSVRGTSVTLQSLAALSQRAADLLQAHVHEDDQGNVGWYRQIVRVDRIGVMATAQSVCALAKLGDKPTRLVEVVRTLVTLRQPSGASTYVSNLSSEEVVDPTCWAIMALVELLPNSPTKTLSGQARKAIGAGVEWLSSAQTAEGGWGITGSAAPRVYSTCVAVRALTAAGLVESKQVRNGVRWLLSVADQQSGGWRDSSGHLSIPATANAVLALAAARRSKHDFQNEIGRATAWLSAIAAQSDGWIAGIYAGHVEEVEVMVADKPTRVEHRYSPRALAIEAICVAGASLAAAIEPLAASMSEASKNGWSQITGQDQAFVSSWALHDWISSVAAFRARFASDSGWVWSDGTRVVFSTSRSLVARFLQRRWILILFLLGGVGLGFGVVAAGMVPSGNALIAVVFVIVTLALSVFANFLTSLLWERTRH